MRERFGALNLDSPYDGLYREVQGVLAAESAERFISVEKSEDGVQMELAGVHFFLPGTAEMPENALPTLQKIVGTLNGAELGSYQVIIEAHVSDAATKAPFASPWELSAARGAAIARFLGAQGIAPERLRVVAYGAVKPLVPSADAEGKPIPENRARNERVTVKVERK